MMNKATVFLAQFKRLPTDLFPFYLSLISLGGLLLIIWALLQLIAYTPPLLFLLLVAFALVSALVTTSLPLVGNSGITYHIGSAISIAAVPLFGLGGAVVIATMQAIIGWLIKPTDPKTWKKTRRQLAFNIGMDAIAIFAAGAVFQLTSVALAGTLWQESLPWFVAALCYEEVNLWLLIGVFRLQHGPTVSVLDLWRKDRWATPVDILLMAVGGGLLAFALEHHDWVGVLIAFLPISLSAYAFRLYVQQMQAYLNNLEQTVSERTQQLTQRTQELTELNQQKDTFISVLSHDMMTPLANIRFSAEMIHDDQTASSENRHVAQLILYSQTTLHNLVRNILDLAKLQALGSVPMQKAPLDLDKLLRQVVEVMVGEATEKEITLTYQMTSSTLCLTADGQQLERVFLNLLSNAIKYTPDGGAVTLMAALLDQQIQVAIQDNGYGIPSDELPYLFERFRRVKGVEGKIDGTGLGLAITKALVEQHGGQITVATKVGAGSTFTVFLPLT